MVNTNWTTDISITTWQQFTQLIRSNGFKLLKNLDAFPNAVLVTGCQRSGTTMLARMITQSAGMTNYWFGEDDELDAALILSGYVEHIPHGRYCFQTTYLDECYQEYYEHHGQFKIVWVIRNPYSVVTSLMYNWRSSALTGTFDRCATDQLRGIEKQLHAFGGTRWISRVRQASFLYKAKTLQLMELADRLGPERVFVVDYDDLVLDSNSILSQIYAFIDLDYDPAYAGQIHNKSVSKKSRLSEREKTAIRNIAEPVYRKAQLLKSTRLPTLQPEHI